VGAGLDTDRGPLARARMKWARLGRAADSVELSLFASVREQSLTSRYHYHFMSDLGSRLKLVPMVSVERLAEKQYITLTSQAGLSLANSWEKQSFQLSAEAGPLLERVNQRRGEGPKRVDNIKLAAKASAMSHLFEYYLSNPRSGWMVTAESSSQFGGVLSEQSVHRLTLQHQFLWNLGGWEPPFLILGWRGLVGSFFFDQESQNPQDIPVSQRFFLGGDENIRGFARKEIPGDGDGFFAMLYQGLELRAGPWVLWGLQPFLFFDYAKGGRQPRKLGPTAYYTPGLGLRYSSPVGVMRVSVGRGFVGHRDPRDPLPHWQPFFSFGKEF
jgi:translocation and assembly module TamA